MFQGRLFFAPSLSYSSSSSAMSDSCMHIYCAITFCGMSHSAPPCFLPLPPRQRKNISSAKINCPGLAWACSKQIYLVPRFMSLHYETYTHTDPHSFPPFSSFLLGALSIACCGTFGRTIKQVTARRTRQYELDIFIVVAAVAVFQMNI